MENYSIFIADDDIDEFIFVKEAFEDNKYEYLLEHYLDGQRLMNRLLKCDNLELPHLVILDINMPKISGIEILRLLKSTDRYLQIPVIMYTTSNSTEQMKECFLLGADAYITKGNSIKTVRNFARKINNFLKDKYSNFGRKVDNSISIKNKI